MNHNYYCVIMAGGIGSRFWPLSKTSMPKQFIDILGTGKSLIQQTYERFNKDIPAENFLVVTNAIYKDLVLEHLPDLKEHQVLLEPMRRNTAPCIEYANQVIQKQNPNASIVVTPSDHLVMDTQGFRQVLSQGLEFVSDSDTLLTIGIQPSRPETGYGYIQKGEKEGDKHASLFRVKTFTEKPNLELAKFFLDSGEFLWNSGIFIWTVQGIQKAFYEYLPDVIELFDEHKSAFGTEQEKAAVNQVYAACVNVSIDYGIMEKSKQVYVIAADFGWSDLGTWGSLYEKLEKDEHQNAINGENVFLYEGQDNIVKVPSDKIVVAQGLEGYILVDTGEALLICKKEQEQNIKRYLQDVENKFGDKAM